jgi:hypothetical protein
VEPDAKVDNAIAMMMMKKRIEQTPLMIPTIQVLWRGSSYPGPYPVVLLDICDPSSARRLPSWKECAIRVCSANGSQGRAGTAGRRSKKAQYCLPMSAEEITFFKSAAGGRNPPKKRVRELWVCGGHRLGKDSMASLDICFPRFRKWHNRHHRPCDRRHLNQGRRR